MDSIEIQVEETSSLSPEQEAAAEAEANPVVEYVRPEKFASEAELGAAYAALEAKLGGKAQEEAPAAEGEVQSDVSTEDLSHYSERFATNGKLEEEDYAGLEAKGISRSMADAYIAGQQAMQNQYEQGVYDVVGGKDSYTEMTQWASTTFTAEEVAIYEEAVNSGDPAKASSAAKGLEARYRVENGKAPTLMQGKTGGAAGETYTSLEQMKADMRNPKYHADPAFRASVARKLEKSDIF